MLQEMFKKYTEKTGETVNLDGFFFDGETIRDDNYEYFKYFKDNGFLFWSITKRHGVKALVLRQTYGNVKGMVDYIRSVCELNGINKIVTMTTRNPKAHIRKWKMEHLEQYDYDYEGRHYYVLVGDLENLR